MSEYVMVESEPTDNADVMELYINQTLTSTEGEHYTSRTDGEEGSPIAQMLFTAVDGIRAMSIYPDHLLVTREADTPWEQLIDDIRDALRDFFL